MQALEGIRILDLSRVAPGAYATMMLGDLGADVIKIESPSENGKRPVGSGVSPTGVGAERVAAYHALNRNKRSMTLNLRTQAARDVFYRLAKESDVVVDVFRPGVVKRLGIDYETVTKLNPKIVYCALSGYGQTGPYAELPGHDINYISFAGALALMGEPDRRPTVPLNLVADYAGGALFVVMGVLTALTARTKTGKGQYVDIAMTDGVISLLSAVVTEYFAHDVVPVRGNVRISSVMEGGVSLSGNEPYYTSYKCKDGKYISIGSIEPHFWENMCKLMEREDFISYQSAGGEKKKQMYAFFDRKFRTRTRDEWFEIIKTRNICVGKVLNMDEVFTDPQVLHRQMVIDVPHPKFGRVKQVGMALKLSDTPGSVRRTAPTLGQDTAEILAGLGYTAAQVKELAQKGAL